MRSMASDTVRKAQLASIISCRVAPNRLATIQVIVRVDRATATLGAQNITLTTRRAE